MGVNFTPFNYSNTKSSSNIGLNNIKSDYSERKISDFNRNLAKNDTSSHTQSKPNYRAKFERLEENDTFR